MKKMTILIFSFFIFFIMVNSVYGYYSNILNNKKLEMVEAKVIDRFCQKTIINRVNERYSKYSVIEKKYYIIVLYENIKYTIEVDFEAYKYGYALNSTSLFDKKLLFNIFEEE